MKKFQFLGAALLLVFPIALIGCGGGGSGGSSVGGSATATPRPTPRPTSRPTSTTVPNGRVLLVQLRDSAGRVVDGIVTVGTLSLPTSAGNASFSGLAAGNVTVSAEVDGVVSTRSASVNGSGTTTLTFVVTPSLTPAPSTPIPEPPF